MNSLLLNHHNYVMRFNFEAVYPAFLKIIKLNKSDVQKQVTGKRIDGITFY